MSKLDISYYNQEENIKFNFRVAAIIKYKDHILLQKSSNNYYWSLIGGRVNLGEDTLSAIAREIKEETGFKLNKKDFKLIRVIENFFEYHIDQSKYHELLFIYTE